MNLDEKKKFIINFAYFALWTIIVFLVFRVAAIYLLPFIIGIMIAYIVQKPSKYLSDRIKINKRICAAVLSVTIFLILITAFLFFCSIIFSRISNATQFLSNQSDALRIGIEKLYSIVERFTKNIDMEFQSTFSKFSHEALNGFIEKIGVFLSNAITKFIKKLPNILISCVITIVATCYISKDYDKILSFTKGFVGNSFYEKVRDFKNIFTECFFKFVVGYFWIFIITFIVLMFGFLFMKIKQFLILALIISLLDMLPIIGTGTVLLPWAIFDFIRNDYKTGFGLVALYLVITILRNFVEPKILGKQIDINPLFTLVFIFIGLRIGGVIGMIIFPIILTVIFTYYRRQFA